MELNQDGFGKVKVAKNLSLRLLNDYLNCRKPDEMPYNEEGTQVKLNELTQGNSEVDTDKILDLFMPVGYVYMSVLSTDPEELFGVGTWVQIGHTLLMDIFVYIWERTA